ncbi:hypothetical protein K353_06620 [Kitasatospora sp. SolWspMP-SS2h]|uniref:hypothetical protein n=1 Tax=Kitasatospora sp. SolWspMP-SS2h TaxID=1305729 RepID=UPI000DBF48D3|nr:hypothetical protein [Kitasatospora sp. SolWspMP-SS2h]RAJ29638.1 hypothetical protein K353_06620 [Kitasatospora sp. SolWspMP-SS2h]
MSGDGGSPGQQHGGGQPYGPGAHGPGTQGPGGGPGYWPGYGQPGGHPHGGWGQSPWGAVPVAPKPGVLPLRPLAFGEMFSAVFDTVRRYTGALYLPLAAVTGVLAVPMVVVAVLLAGRLGDAYNALPDTSRGEEPTGDQLWALGWPLLVVFGLILLLGIVQYVIAGPLATVVLRAATLGRRMTAGQAWKEARPRLGAAVASMALLYGPLLVLNVLLVGLAVGLGTVTGSVPLFLLLLLLSAAIGVAGVYAVVRLAPQVPVLVLEDSTPKAAIGRAWQLNRGNWWRSFGLTALVTAIGRVAAGVISYPLSIALSVLVPLSSVDFEGESARLQLSHGTMTAVLVGYSLLVLFGTLATGPLVPLVNGVLYIDRRIRNERLDIALAEAAGIHFAEAYGYPQAAPSAPAQPASAQPAPSAPVPPQPGAPAEPGTAAEPSAGEGPAGR